MKQIIATMVMLFAMTAVQAQDATSQVQGVSASTQNGVDVNTGTQGNNSGNYTAQATDMSRMVGIAAAPALTTTLTETCMGSTSAGAGWSGASISFGTTWRDSACVRRLDARQMSALNEVPIAVEMMCDSDLVREAAVRAGRPCVADGGQPRGLPVVAVIQEQVVPTEEAAATTREEVRE